MVATCCYGGGWGTDLISLLTDRGQLDSAFISAPLRLVVAALATTYGPLKSMRAHW